MAESRDSFPFTSAQKDVLNEYFDNHQSDVCRQYNTGRAHFKLDWRRELRDKLNTDTGPVNQQCNAAHVTQYMCSLVARKQQREAAEWQPTPEVLAEQQQQLQRVGDWPKKKQLWDVLDSVRDKLPAAPLTLQHVEQWLRRRKAGKADKARQQQSAQEQHGQRRRGGNAGNQGASSAWYNQHPALRDLFEEAADALFEARLREQQAQQQGSEQPQAREAWQTEADDQQRAKAVVRQLKAKDVLQLLRTEAWKERWQQQLCAACIANLRARQTRSVFNSWQLDVVLRNSRPVRLEADPTKRAGLPLSALCFLPDVPTQQ